jgi:hypothetical protein
MHRDAAQLPLSGVVGQADAAILEEAGEGFPALEHVVHRLGDLGMARQPGPLGSHPGFEVGDEQRGALGANRATLGGQKAVDLAFDVEDRVDALHRFERQRRDHGQPAVLGFGGDIGEHEELATRMRPACRLDERTSFAAGVVEPVEPRISIGLKDPDVAAQVALRVLARTVARVEEHCRRRRASGERTVIAHIDPGPSGRRPARRQHRHRRVVAVHALAGEHMGTYEVVERAQHCGAAAHLIRQRRQAQIDPFTRIALGLPVERLMLPVLLEQDHRQ